MVVFALFLLVTASSSVLGCTSSTEQKLSGLKNQTMADQLAAVFREMETLRCGQSSLQREQVALTQKHRTCGRAKAREALGQRRRGTNILSYGPNTDEEGAEVRDPCFHYTVLDQAWRATNTTTKLKMCDRNVKWKGWYRLFYNGKSIQMPERCIPTNKCGTHSPLWLAGPHPKRRHGVVTRKVCGHWKKRCCAFRSTPIQVKKCLGNYYVYRLAPPSACYLAYCADINTLVCGRCRRNQSCVSRDKINWRCKRKKLSSRKVHFFASYPAQLVGKVNRIKYSKVLVNVGRGFNTRTGVFRAPVKGIYQFFFSTQTTGVKTDLWLVVNSYWVSVSHTSVGRPSSVGALSTYMTFLRRGSVVYVTQNCGRSWANAASTTITFGGSLLVQMS
ncbi:uncharacterized protein [Takifugu rubripes]|uniref:uncharacterized protein n=1 Tax=Takifugu rubripes TaxID=31033 RepID=UPI0011459DD5|nr:uncharacterized protein LOC101074617 [Takifugu rubripes]XP_011611066.2 uncharacterized protein LOC101074617 [Takifugu rubripes]